MIQFTLSQAWAVILSICGGIVTISAAVSVAFKIYQHFKKPNLKQDEEIESLWKKVIELENSLRTTREEFLTFFKNDKARLDAIEKGNRVTMQALIALLSHGIDGNDVDSMKKAKDALNQYLVQK